MESEVDAALTVRKLGPVEAELRGDVGSLESKRHEYHRHVPSACRRETLCFFGSILCLADVFRAEVQARKAQCPTIQYVGWRKDIFGRERLGDALVKKRGWLCPVLGYEYGRSDTDLWLKPRVPDELQSGVQLVIPRQGTPFLLTPRPRSSPPYDLVSSGFSWQRIEELLLFHLLYGVDEVTWSGKSTVEIKEAEAAAIEAYAQVTSGCLSRLARWLDAVLDGRMEGGNDRPWVDPRGANKMMTVSRLDPPACLRGPARATSLVSKHERI